MDGREDAAGFLALPLAHEEPGEARRCSQFPRVCALPAGDRNSLAERGFRLFLVGLPDGEKQLAFEPVEFRFVEVDLRLLRLGEPLPRGREPFLDPDSLEARLGEKA